MDVTRRHAYRQRAILQRMALKLAATDSAENHIINDDEKLSLLI